MGQPNPLQIFELFQKDPKQFFIDAELMGCTIQTEQKKEEIKDSLQENIIERPNESKSN